MLFCPLASIHTGKEVRL